MEEKLKLVRALLSAETTLTLATVSAEGEACATPLFYILDDELSLYWLSSPGSRHSLNLLSQPRAEAAVSRSAQGWREIRGVQMRGQVSVVSEPERRKTLLNIYCERFKLGRIFRLAIRQSELYCLRPEFFRYLDNARGFGFKFEMTRGNEGWG
jgi:hypothetical protein